MNNLDIQSLQIHLGLYVCSDLRKGKKLIEDRTFRDNSAFLAQIFEIGRRYKIMNPDKMRSTYGKLMYILMDASQGVLDFEIILPIKTVGQQLDRIDEIYCDALLVEATQNAENAEEVSSRDQAKAALIAKYGNSVVNSDMIERCIHSICDANNYAKYNRDPVNRMIDYLKYYFDPSHVTSDTDLEIRYGYGGSKLSHSHSTQYSFVLQSLILWSEIQNDMYWLWINADMDMLGNSYRLCNTGQGENDD